MEDSWSSFSAVCKKVFPRTFSTKTRAMDVVLSGLKAWMVSSPCTALQMGPASKTTDLCNYSLYCLFGKTFIKKLFKKWVQNLFFLNKRILIPYWMIYLHSILVQRPVQEQHYPTMTGIPAIRIHWMCVAKLQVHAIKNKHQYYLRWEIL